MCIRDRDYLREGIGLRAYSQRDPLVEYQREGFDMFAAMKEGIREETVGFLFHVEVEEEPEPVPGDANFELDPSAAAAASLQSPVAAPIQSPLGVTEPHAHARARGAAQQPPSNLTYAGPSEDGRVEVRGSAGTAKDPYSGVGRNQLCPCGSGQKFKRCHGGPGGGPMGSSLTA